MRYALAGFADRVWDMRHHYTTYDVCYLMFAEVLRVPLYTCDHKLVDDGHGAGDRGFPRTH